VQQELIVEIHRITISPVVTVDGKIGKPSKTDYIDREGSYILLTLNLLASTTVGARINP